MHDTEVKNKVILGRSTLSACSTSSLGTSGEDFPALMKKLDDHAFLCGGKVGSNRSGFLRVSWVNPNLF
jgi:hypothetical protein